MLTQGHICRLGLVAVEFVNGVLVGIVKPGGGMMSGGGLRRNFPGGTALDGATRRCDCPGW